MKLSRKLSAVEIFIKLRCWVREVHAIFKHGARSVCSLRCVMSVKHSTVSQTKQAEKQHFHGM